MPFSSYQDDEGPKARPNYVIKLFSDKETGADQVCHQEQGDRMSL
jgi:hypothetical protein